MNMKSNIINREKFNYKKLIIIKIKNKFMIINFLLVIIEIKFY